MLNQKINRDDPDRVFIIAHNNEGGALARGDVVEMDMDGDAGVIKGVSVEKSDAASNSLVAGVVEGKTFGGGSIAAGDRGLVQVYGRHDAAATAATTAAATVVVGNASGAFAAAAATDLRTVGFTLAAESGGTAPVFITAM